MAAHEMERDLRWGQLALALEVVTLIRTLESIPVVNEWEREGTVATLHTLLREQGLEEAYEVYETLATWRRVRFERVASPRASAYAGGWSVQSSGGNDPSSLREDRARGQLHRGKPDAPLPARRDPARDSSPTHEQLALPVVEARETPNG
jgi:hypothetical protein